MQNTNRVFSATTEKGSHFKSWWASKRVHLTDVCQGKSQCVRISLAFRIEEKFDSAQLNENFTALIYIMYEQLLHGSKYTETKINLKRLHRCWWEGDKLWKKRKWKLAAEQTCRSRAQKLCFINWKTTWSEWRNSNRANNPLENFSSEAICTFMNWRLFLANLSVVFWTKCAWRWASMSRENGIFGPDKRRRFRRLSEGEYLYGIPLQGQKFCWEIKVNLVIGNANVFCMWEQMTEAMCCNLYSNANVLS